MKKTIAILGGATALLSLAVPAWAHRRRPRWPDFNGNIAIVDSAANSMADTGGNVEEVSGPMEIPVTGTIDTGDAYADAWSDVVVGRQEIGCCDEDLCVDPCFDPCFDPCEPDPCQEPCGPGADDCGCPAIDVNLAVVDSEANAMATTGDNRLRVSGGSGVIRTGNASALSTSSVLVNVQMIDVY